MFKLISTAFVLAIATASAQKPMVASQAEGENFPTDPWGVSDWVLGVVMGVYGPLNARARDDDCFSAWYTWGVASIELSNFFNKAFDIHSVADWASLIIKMGLYSYETYLVPAICVPELEWNKANPWFQNYGFMSNDVKLPFVGAMSSEEIAFTVKMSIELALGIVFIYAYWVSEFYYWGLGMSMGKLASNIFVAIDVWGKFNVITPTPARIRYLDN